MTAVLEVRGLCKVHGDGEAEVVALHDVDLALGHGEFLAVTGPSGCGSRDFNVGDDALVEQEATKGRPDTIEANDVTLRVDTAWQGG